MNTVLPDRQPYAGPERRSEHRACIGIVDDDALSCALQARLVKLLGYNAEPTAHAETAVAQAMQGLYDVLLLDLGMPGLDGFAALAELRSREAREGRPPLPVIAVTGYASDTDRLRCLMAGFHEHLAKPVEIDALGAAIERCLADRAAARQLPVANDAARLRATAQRLERLKPGDNTFGPTVLETFALRSQHLIEGLTAACRAQDSVEAELAAEALRASADFMGAQGLARLASQAHTAAGAGDFVRLAALLQSIGDEHQAVLTVLLTRPPVTTAAST